MLEVVVAEDRFCAPERRMPSIIEAWFSSSEKMMQPGSSLAMVEIAASLETKPEVKTRPLPCRAGRRAPRSSSTSGMVGAGDVAGAAGAGAHRASRLVHGVDHGGVLAHAEIVVGAPDGDFAGPSSERQKACGKRPAMRSRSAKTR